MFGSKVARRSGPNHELPNIRTSEHPNAAEVRWLGGSEDRIQGRWASENPLHPNSRTPEHPNFRAPEHL